MIEKKNKIPKKVLIVPISTGSKQRKVDKDWDGIEAAFDNLPSQTVPRRGRRFHGSAPKRSCPFIKNTPNCEKISSCDACLTARNQKQIEENLSKRQKGDYSYLED